jgi:hypothetical protein
MYTSYRRSWLFAAALLAGWLGLFVGSDVQACSSRENQPVATPGCCANVPASTCHCCEAKSVSAADHSSFQPAIVHDRLGATEPRSGLVPRSTPSGCGCWSSPPASSPEPRQPRPTEEPSGKSVRVLVIANADRWFSLLTSIAHPTAFLDGDSSRALRTSHLRF